MGDTHQLAPSNSGNNNIRARERLTCKAHVTKSANPARKRNRTPTTQVSHACVRTVGGCSGAGLAAIFFSSHLPRPRTPCQARLWKEVTFSKVCLNRDDMWMCWHDAALSAPHRRIGRRCQKSSCACFLSLLLIFFHSLFFKKKKKSLSLLPPPKPSIFASENRVTVCFTGCSIPQVYPDLKIPIKWRAGARYLE